MKKISEVVKDLDVPAHMLRDWEDRGYFGEVLQIGGKRVYSDDQIERIKFVLEKVTDQREEDVLRTDYSEIDSAFLDRFGGIVTSVPQTPTEMVSGFMDQLGKRDTDIQNALESIKDLMQEMLEKPQLELPVPIDYSLTLEEVKKELESSQKRENELLSIVESIQNDVNRPLELPDTTKYSELMDSHQELIKLHNGMTSKFNELIDSRNTLVDRLEELEKKNRDIGKKNEELEIENEELKTKKWWKFNK